MMQFKRAVSLLLALCLAVTILPAEALAVGIGGSEFEPLVEDRGNTIILADEGVGVQSTADVATGSSTDELTAKDGETPLPSITSDEPLQSVSELRFADDAGNDQRDHNYTTEVEEPGTVPALVTEQDMDTPVENEEKTITRIAWIHELAVRFCTSQGDCADYTDVVFSDYGQSEEFYQDAVWAWNTGLFEENEGMSIRPFAAATREFTAYTLASCLDLGLSGADASTYAMEEDTALPEETQIALSRGWFDGEDASFDSDVGYEEAGAMLSDAEEIAALGEVREDYASTYEYADGVIEVPEDIHFEISPDETTVTLYSDALPIEAGDDFVIYLDSLPLAYTALAVVRENGSTTISVEKAEASVFAYVDAQGVIPLTEENSEFIPAEGVELMSISDGLSFSNGKLSLSIPLGVSKVEVYLENMRLNHSFSDDGFTITVSGTWGLSNTYAYEHESLKEIPLGKVRVFGVGVVALKLSFSMGVEMSSSFSGTFTAGASVLSDGTARAIHEFSVNNYSTTGKGELGASLKVSAGVDILVAQAIVYGEVGLQTQYTPFSYNSGDSTIYCEDFKFYLFLTVGADLNYYAFWKGEMETLVGKKLLDEAKGPFIWRKHWENGKFVGGSCNGGLNTPDLQLGGTTAVTDGSLSFDELGRNLETSVTLPGDVTTQDDFTIGNGAALNLNGHTLTVNGDLIVEDGSLNIGTGSGGTGTLNVTGNLLLKKGSMSIYGGTASVGGDFRIQSVTENAAGGTVYGETDAYLYMNNNGVLTVGGNFVTQSTRPMSYNVYASGCTINLKGDFSQLTGAKDNFACNAKVVFCGQDIQNIYFADPAASYFTNPSFKANAKNIKINSKIKGWSVTEDVALYQNLDLIGTFTVCDGHTLTVNGDLIVEDGSLNIGTGSGGTGTLNVTGNLLLKKGSMSIYGGTASVGGDFRIQSVTENAAGGTVYGETDAYLYMNNKGVLTVGGNFVTQSTRSSSYNVYANDCTINLKGDFSQLTGAADNFFCNAKVVFCGQDVQNIYFADPAASYFTNPSFKANAKNIKINSKIKGWTVTEDVTLYQNLELIGIFTISDGNTFTVNGDLIVDDGILDIGTGTLNVTGNLLLKKGCMSIAGGIASVGGDFRIQSVTENAVGGTVYGETDAYLCMLNESVLTVGGNFVTQSKKGASYNIINSCTINLKGDFSQLTGAKNNFACDAKVVLCGTEKQTVTFTAYPSSKFTTLQLTQPMSNYVFDPNPCWDTLIVAAEMTTPVLQTNGSAGTIASQITCSPSISGKDAVMIAAFYDGNNRMLSAWVQDGFTLQNEMDLVINGNLPDGYGSIKLFLLDSITRAPICEAKKASVGG